ncbi:MAG: LPS export ABC transporter periplasmic protein LptC [Gammaproteobacteria bacterium]
MAYKNTIISLATISILSLAVWTTLLSLHSGNKPVVQASTLPDAFMEDVHALIMNKQGKPSMKIATPKLTHYPDNNTTLLTTPALTLYRQSPQPWYVNAEHATALQGIDIIDFKENVIIHHAADGNNPATIIKTETLRVHPEKQTAETNDFITMTQPNLVVKATGMEADMNNGDIKLLSQARGEYVPNM